MTTRETIKILTYTVGPFQENTYLVSDGQSNEAAVIDPGGETARIMAEVKKRGWTVTHILQTHGHIDHIAGTAEMKARTGAQVFIHSRDASALTDPGLNLSQGMGKPVIVHPPDGLLTDGLSVHVGDLVFKVLHTPGHTPGGVCFLVRDVLFSGDTLFAHSIGRTDFPGGNEHQLKESIRKKLFVLPGYTLVYPGHGEPTRIADENGQNPFL